MPYPIDGNGKTCGVDCACSHGECEYPNERRKDDVRLQAQAAESVARSALPYREALARQIEKYPNNYAYIAQAANKLRRDEQTNAECIDVLVRAGYTDIPAQIDAALIRRLLGYITPR